jgi:SAM-dependent methyltransferase
MRTRFDSKQFGPHTPTKFSGQEKQMDIGDIYSREFFAGQFEGSARSAGVVVPLVLSLVPAKSVVDVGCGVGPWAASFLANGVSDVWGVDGDYVQSSQLLIPVERFIARDLRKPLLLDRHFDLAVSLEVAEHLPPSRAASFVDDLTRLAPCILFSAAIPGPTGTDHINSQYLPYWIELFQKRQYEAIDPIRPQIWGKDSVEWFYQQNIVIFAASGHPLLARERSKPQTFIHHHIYEQVLHATPSLGVMAKAFPTAVYRSIRYRLGLR